MNGFFSSNDSSEAGSECRYRGTVLDSFQGKIQLGRLPRSRISELKWPEEGLYEIRGQYGQ